MSAHSIILRLPDFDALDERLQAMNEAGMIPALPFIDAYGTASIAHGTAPCGDDWEVDYEAPRDPDTGSAHCCTCSGHLPIDCDSGAMWRPTFPIVALALGSHGGVSMSAPGTPKARATETQAEDGAL